MQSRASYALVGLLTLTVMSALFGFALWFGSGGSNTLNVRIVFHNKVSGLGRGSSVLFNGLRVGEVTEVAIQPGNPREIYAVVKVDRSAPLRVDTRASLEGQGLAGVVVVQLRGGDPSSAALAPQAGESLPTIIADPSPDIFEKVRSIAKNTDDALIAIDIAIKQNRSAIGDTVKNVERFSGSLSENSNEVGKLMENLGGVADFIAPIPDKLGAFSQEATDFIRSMDRDKVVEVVDRTAKFTASLGAATNDVRTTVKEVASMSEKLNRAADHVEGALKGAEAFLNSAVRKDSRTVFDDITEVARSIRDIAQNLDKRSTEITAGITRFTRASLRSIEAFATDGRGRLRGFSRTLRGVERDPQGLLFGSKPQLPQYNGPR